MAIQEQSVEQVFEAVLELEPARRVAFLDAACQGRPEVRQVLDGLLCEHEQCGSFLERPLLAHRQPSGSAKEGTTTVGEPGDRKFSSRFQAGDLIAGRFVVTRFIDHGGMGEVYEVADKFLQDAHVALKMIRPEIAADRGNSHRFEQEVILARKVNHPNLCPIYEIFRCELPAPPFLFFTMKLLHGETLAARLQGAARVSRPEVTQICTELISGVAALHGAGVIHRDIKPNNAMLEWSGSRLCVSIMDFGLARLYESESTLLKPGMIAGTPGYIAPELIRGGRPTRATDIFALGVVMHQVLTRERPAEARDGVGLVPRPALETADAPRSLIKAVKGFLSADPDQRCRSFDGICAETQTHSSAETLSRPSMTRRQFALGSAASLCLVGGAAAWKRDRLYDVLHPLPPKRFVALLNWPPRTDDRVRPMVLSLIDAMAAELARAEAFDRNFFVAAQKSSAGIGTTAQMNEVRESLGANLVLATSGAMDGKNVRVFLQVLDPETGRALRSRDIRAPIAQQFSLPQRVVRTAAELLDVGQYAVDDRHSEVGTENAAALTAFRNAEAYRKQENDTGLEQAIEKYSEALELDPHYALAQAKLGWAYLRTYGKHDDAADLVMGRDNCESAIALDPDLVEAHLGLAWALEQTGDRAAASAEMAKALALDPTNSHTLIYQARLYEDGRHYKEAEETFDGVVRLRPNFWLARSEFGALLEDEGKYGEALTQYKAAGKLARRNALALSNIGSIYLKTGKLDQAVEYNRLSFSLEPNDNAAAGLASASRFLRRYPDAIGYASAATKLNPAAAANWLELADCYAAAGKSRSEARAAYERAAAAQEEELQTQKKNGPGWMLLALCRTKLGEPGSANALMEKAEAFNADDMTSQLIKVRTLELLGRRDEALSEVAQDLSKGATVFQLQNLPDLEGLRADPRYLQLAGAAISGSQSL